MLGNAHGNLADVLIQEQLDPIISPTPFIHEVRTPKRGDSTYVCPLIVL